MLKLCNGNHGSDDSNASFQLMSFRPRGALEQKNFTNTAAASFVFGNRDNDNYNSGDDGDENDDHFGDDDRLW